MDSLIPALFLPLPLWVAFAFIIVLPVVWGFISNHWYYSSIETFCMWNPILQKVLMAVILFMAVASRFFMGLPEKGFD